MDIPANLPRLKGFRYPREVIAYTVWAYHRFALSTADVEDLLAERDVIVRGQPFVSGSIDLGATLQTASDVTYHT